jgi:hypothetical protein
VTGLQCVATRRKVVRVSEGGTRKAWQITRVLARKLMAGVGSNRNPRDQIPIVSIEIPCQYLFHIVELAHFEHRCDLDSGTFCLQRCNEASGGENQTIQSAACFAVPFACDVARAYTVATARMGTSRA